MMLIGTNLYSCLKDIISGEVDEEEVLVIICKTTCTELQDFTQYIENAFQVYNVDNTIYDFEKVEQAKNVGISLWQNGKIHQPRIFNDTHYLSGNVLLLPIWLMVHPKNYTNNKVIIDAWEKFVVLETLFK